MNPYFDMYEYEMLDLDEGLYAFFDKNKDYKSLKEYESKVLGYRREIKEIELREEARERMNKREKEERER